MIQWIIFLLIDNKEANLIWENPRRLELCLLVFSRNRFSVYWGLDGDGWCGARALRSHQVCLLDLFQLRYQIKQQQLNRNIISKLTIIILFMWMIWTIEWFQAAKGLILSYHLSTAPRHLCLSVFFISPEPFVSSAFHVNSWRSCEVLCRIWSNLKPWILTLTKQATSAL